LLPHERLLAAILCRAWLDATRGRGDERATALIWLHSDGAAAVCDWLGLDVDTMRQRLGSPLRRESQNRKEHPGGGQHQAAISAPGGSEGEATGGGQHPGGDQHQAASTRRRPSQHQE